ncbi:MAG: hypothetical protein AB1563_10530 [Bacillota bacterium]
MTWDDILNEIALQGGYVPSLHPKAFDELQGLLRRDMAVAKMVAAAIVKLCKNPLPQDMGGVGRRLGKRKETGDLRLLLYVKLKGAGIRIVYALNHSTAEDGSERTNKSLTIAVISKREDMEAYLEALKRKPDLLADWPEEWAK